eukprot:TRINITY_DN51352_c0_g1_i1.p1 TRINITY_DN51352_c0_g1~~TRINITY_DN51352_c0_g1_i1.p1  ORF type:complete len:194 (+),score=57.23 TRINITY_DN51352_c0_g1_i1:40-582(+)
MCIRDRPYDAWLGSGSYRGTMTQGATCLPVCFKLRLVSGGSSKLFERLGCDDGMGLDAHGLPAGLYKLSGTVHNPATAEDPPGSIALSKGYVLPRARHQALALENVSGDLSAVQCEPYCELQGTIQKGGCVQGSWQVCESFKGGSAEHCFEAGASGVFTAKRTRRQHAGCTPKHSKPPQV